MFLQVCYLVFKVTAIVSLPLLLLLTSNFAALWVAVWIPALWSALHPLQNLLRLSFMIQCKDNFLK